MYVCMYVCMYAYTYFFCVCVLILRDICNFNELTDVRQESDFLSLIDVLCSYLCLAWFCAKRFTEHPTAVAYNCSLATFGLKQPRLWWPSSECSFRYCLCKCYALEIWLESKIIRIHSNPKYFHLHTLLGWSHRLRLGWLVFVHWFTSSSIRRRVGCSGACRILGSRRIHSRRRFGDIQATTRDRDQARPCGHVRTQVAKKPHFLFRSNMI